MKRAVLRFACRLWYNIDDACTYCMPIFLHGKNRVMGGPPSPKNLVKFSEIGVTDRQVTKGLTESEMISSVSTKYMLAW